MACVRWYNSWLSMLESWRFIVNVALIGTALVNSAPRIWFLNHGCRTIVSWYFFMVNRIITILLRWIRVWSICTATHAVSTAIILLNIRWSMVVLVLGCVIFILNLGILLKTLLFYIILVWVSRRIYKILTVSINCLSLRIYIRIGRLLAISLVCRIVNRNSTLCRGGKRAASEVSTAATRRILI